MEDSFEVLDDPPVPEDELDDDEDELALSGFVAALPSDPVEDFSPDSLPCAFFLASDG